MYYKFNTANGTPEIFSSIYTEIESNTNGAESGKIALRAAGAGTLATGLILIGSTRNVGIGTSLPRTRLNVQSSVGASSYTGVGPGDVIRASGSGQGNWIASEDDGAMAYFGIDSGQGKFAAYNYGTSTEMTMILGQSRMFIYNNGLVRIPAGSNTTGLCINETDVRISNNQSNYGKYKIAAAAVTSGTAHLGRKCANGYSTNAIIAEYWGVEEVWAKGAIAYKRISSYDQGEFQWWLNATAAGTEVSSSDTKMRLERTGALHINGSLTQNASDERMKENITLIPNALEKVKQLRGVSFTWKEIENSPHEAGTEDIGVIAQDVEAVLPLIVKPAPFDTYTNTTDEGDEETKETTEVVSRSGENYKTVEYEKLVPLLIESIKELEARVAELEG
jgi:hypothetical protein